MKRSLFLVFVVTILTMLGSYAYAEESINVTINDEPIIFDAQPIMKNDRILVPIRKIAEKMLFEVTWEEDTQEITLENFNTILTMNIGDYSITKDLKLASKDYPTKITNIRTDIPSTIIDDRTYLPLRIISELFGAEVNWNEANNTAEIFYANTYGKEVTFEDKGIEYLTKLELLLEGCPSIRSISIIYYNSDILKRFLDCTIDELYPIKIHEGALKKITAIGSQSSYIVEPEVYNINDVRKFPNLNNIYLPNQHVSDLTPITFKQNWADLVFFNNPIFDFEALSNIHCIYGDIGISNYNFFGFENCELWIEYLKAVSNQYKNAINEKIKENMTIKEKIVAINDWIQDNIKYDFDHKRSNKQIEDLKKEYGDNYPMFYTDSILTHYGVCENYTEIFNTFCIMLDIPCIPISGTAHDNKHAWNVVKLEDGKTYHVDTTWNLLFVDENDLKNVYEHKWNDEDITKGFLNMQNNEL